MWWKKAKPPVAVPAPSNPQVSPTEKAVVSYLLTCKPPPVNNSMALREDELDRAFEREWDAILEEGRQAILFKANPRTDLCFEYIASL